MAHNIGMTCTDHSRESRSVSPSPLSNATRLVYPVIGRPHATIGGPSVTVALSKPHRAWEEGYRSPFSQTPPQPLRPLHTDAQWGPSASNTGSQFKTSWTSQKSLSALQSMEPTVQRAPTPPVSLPNFPQGLPMDEPPVSPNAQHTTPRRTCVYRPRTRKVVTKEITLDDKDVAAMVTLGLSPFMVGQDMIANQNRFVRNECALARHFLRFQRATSDADARHSQMERDICSHLEQQKSALDMLTNGCGPTTSATSNMGTDAPCADRDFLELKQAHKETSARLEALSLQVAKSSQLTQRALTDLANRLDQIIHTGIGYTTDPDDIFSSPADTNSFPLLLSSTNPSNIKRRRTSYADSIIDSPSTAPPPTPDFHNHD